MQTTVIDGVTFRQMLKNGYLNLKRNCDAVNALNVFPVPDGDTGINMSKTMLGGIEAEQTDEQNVGMMMKSFSRGTLLSARGNSGVILSQFIRGMAKGVKECASLDVAGFSAMIGAGVAQAYKSVVTPVEGTMLTVMRESAEYLENAGKFDSFEDCFDKLVPAIKDSVRRTPEKLDVLREAGVVDSGGAGVLCIFEGMQMMLAGEIIEDDVDESFVSESLHELKETFGGKSEHKKYAVAAALAGDGIIEYFRQIGVDAVINGGQTNNPSAEDFITAFNSLDAEYIIVLPNNSNVVMTAEQAAKMYGKADVRIIKTKSVAEGYSAMSMFNPILGSIDEIIDGMSEYLDFVTTGYVTVATRDANINGIAIKKDNFIGLDSDTIRAAGDDKIATAVSLLHNLPDIDDKQVFTVFYGADVTKDELNALESCFENEFPLVEYGFMYGGQDVYSFIFAIE